MQKKQLTIVIVSLLVVILSVSLAYFATQIVGKGKEVSVTSTNLQIVFTDSDGEIAGTVIEPGWSVTKSFTITNNSKSEYNYDIVIKDLENTFVTEGYLQYKITSTNGGYSMADYKEVPKPKTVTDTILAYNISISVGQTQAYTIEFIYPDDEDVDQSDDMGMKLSGKLFITEGTEQPVLAAKILEDNLTRTTRNTFDTTFTSNTTGTLYTATEKNVHNTADTTVYYYAGNTTNNWVKFGKYLEDKIAYRGYLDETSTDYREYSTLSECNNATSYNTNCAEITYWKAGDPIYWRIIRTNADGSVRLLYHGTSTTSTTAYIGGMAFNDVRGDSIYLGYMYGTSGSLASNRTNSNDSSVKTYIDNWYKDYLNTNYGKYLSTTAVYCNDREVGSGTYSATGTQQFFNAGYTRLVTNKTPSYDCTVATDAFSVDNTSAKLTYPVALMTADELVYAGGKWLTALTTPYAWFFVNKLGSSSTGNENWVLMTPNIYANGYSYMFSVRGGSDPGYLYAPFLHTYRGVRPVTSLKSCVKYSSGDGTASNPYTIEETTSGC